MNNYEKKVLGSLLASTLVSSNLVLANAEKLGETQYYLTHNLNMRNGPGLDYISVGTLKKDSIVIPLKYSQDKLWAQVKYNNQYVWICTTYIKEVKKGNKEESDLGNYKTKERLNLRKGSSTGELIILTIPKGTIIKAIDVSKDGKWAYINCNDEIGWVNFSYIEKLSNEKLSNKDENKLNNDSDTYYDYITISGVNVRIGPGASYKKIGVLNKNVVVKPLGFDKYENWVKFNYNGEEAWVCKLYLKNINDKDNVDNNSKCDKYTALYNLNLRKGPSTSYGTLGQIQKNETFDFIKLSTDKVWANVRYKSTTGWVSYQYIKQISSSNEDSNTIKTLYTSANLNLRTDSNTISSKLCTIPKNTKISFISYNTDKTWAKVKYNNKIGWVSATYLK